MEAGRRSLVLFRWVGRVYPRLQWGHRALQVPHVASGWAHVWNSHGAIVYQSIIQVPFFYFYREKERRHPHHPGFLSLPSPPSSPLACWRQLTEFLTSVTEENVIWNVMMKLWRRNTQRAWGRSGSLLEKCYGTFRACKTVTAHRVFCR